MLDVTVITPAITSRLERLLPLAISSVKEQDRQPAAHLIGVDYRRVGGAAMRNQLWRSAGTTYIAVLDDDDLLYSNHLSTLVAAAGKTRADITYTWCEVFGRPGWNPNSHFDPERLERENYIPSTALYRRSKLEELGGWRDPEHCPHGWPDYDLHLRVLRSGGTFTCVPEITWGYVFHGGNTTMVPGGEPEAS